VDKGRRDEARVRLDAYVSVSTGLWRIGLPGDDPKVPMVPDDALREFEEWDLRERDPGTRPTEGDVRVRGGSPAEVRIEAGCAPVPGGEGWLTGGPFSVVVLDGAGGGRGREIFKEVGSATLYRDAACAVEGPRVRVMGWVVSGQG
jgi:hypothetical protein